MTSQTDIERIVMRRVHLIRILQFVISAGIFAALAFSAALWGVGREVWVARVFENAPASPSKLGAFYFTAFIHTRLIVQALVVLTLASLLLLVREVSRLVLHMFTPPSS